jgi:hypothetical protein
VALHFDRVKSGAGSFGADGTHPQERLPLSIEDNILTCCCYAVTRDHLLYSPHAAKNALALTVVTPPVLVVPLS